MGDYAEKKFDNESLQRLGVGEVESAARLGAFQVKDNRPQAVAHKSLRDQITQSPFTKVAAQFQAMANAKHFIPKVPKNQLSNAGVAQLATKITHETEPFELKGGKLLEIAKSMEAYLDPNDPVKGSATGGGADELALGAEVCHKGDAEALDRTHLLHYDLGGFGVVKNLYPMTKLANSNMRRDVESEVLQQMFVGLKKDGPNGVFYKVDVDGKRDVESLWSAETKFNCSAQYFDKGTNALIGDPFLRVSISSSPFDPTKNKSRPDGIPSADSEWYSGKYNNKITPAEWEHGGRSGEGSKELSFDSFLNKKIFIKRSGVKSVLPKTGLLGSWLRGGGSVDNKSDAAASSSSSTFDASIFDNDKSDDDVDYGPYEDNDMSHYTDDDKPDE